MATYNVRLLRLAVLTIVNCFLQNAYAQNYPVKPVRLLIGFPPGGGADVVARSIMPSLGELLGQQIVVENRGGAAGNIASELLAKSPADGYVLMLSTPSITINPSLYGKAGFNPVSDFAPIAMIGLTPLILISHPSMPIRSVRDLIVLVRSRPGQLSYSSGGSGAAAHLAGELLKSMTGTDIVHVPFKGSPPSLIALIGGEVHFTFGSLTSSQPYINAGRLRAIAVTSAQRTAFVPGLPTLSEAGIPGYEVTQWYGLLAPAQTPATIIARLHGELVKVLEMQDIRAQLANQGLEITPSNPRQFSILIKSEFSKWAKVVRESGMRVD